MALAEGLDAKKILEQIDRLPAPARFGILAGVAAVLIAVYWFTIFSSTRQNLASLKTQLTQIESDIVEATFSARGVHAVEPIRARELG